LSDISCFQAMRWCESERGPIEFSRTRHASMARNGTSIRRGCIARGNAPDTEFISVRTLARRAPMNRSLDWGRDVFVVPRVGRVANLGHSIFTLK
jgi:hypothetical protein